ncbi:MAG: hypothetical protein QXL51_05170 [Candidatus Aenigmatarchaeota archaeon]
MEIVLSERTNRKDKYEVLKKLMEEIKEKYSKTDVEIKNMFFNEDGWLIIDVSEEKFFINTINKLTIFPLTVFNKQFLITGKIENVKNDHIRIIFPNEKGETSILDIKIKNLIRKIGISKIDFNNSLKEMLHIKKLSPIHVYLGREKNISYYHANMINEWYKKGLSAVNVNDVTMTELKNVISERNLDKVIIKIYPLTILSYRLVLRIGAAPEVVENEIKKSFEEIGIDIVTSSFNWRKAISIFSY